MRHTLRFLCLPLLFFSLHCNALFISDTYVVNRQLPLNDWAGTIFELIPLGYSPSTDTITNIKLIYDFSEIYAQENQGDEDQYIPGGPDEGVIYQDEFAIFHSWIFGWRDVHPDVDSGLTVFETNWQRNDFCQLWWAAVPGDDTTVYCALNIDQDGNLNASVTSYSDYLWLNSIRVEVEFDRLVPVPEPSAALLLFLGLLSVAGFSAARFLHKPL